MRDGLPLCRIQTAVSATLLPVREKRQPYPLSWVEQTRLLQALPNHLADMALFPVNTGCRDAEICGLRWAWEIKSAGAGHLGLRRPRP